MWGNAIIWTIYKKNANYLPASKIKTLIGVKKKSLPQELTKVNRIAQHDYSGLILAKMYGTDSEVFCKQWLKEVLEWSMVNKIMRISSQHPWLCRKTDEKLSISFYKLKKGHK